MRLPHWLTRQKNIKQRDPEPALTGEASDAPGKAGTPPAQPSPFRVLVYGYDDLKPMGREQLPDGIAMHYDAGDSRFDDFDCVVLPYRAFLDRVEAVRTYMEPTRYAVHVREAERDRRAKEIEVLLHKGGVVCWLLDEVPQVAPPSDSESMRRWIETQASANFRAYPGFRHLYYWAGYALSDPWSSAFPGLLCRRSEFAQWVASHASTRHPLVLVEPDRAPNAQAICTFPNDDPAGLAIPAPAGLVLILPYVPGNRPQTEVASAMRDLARALRRYRDAVIAAPPPWLEEFCFTHERTIRDELARLDQARAELSAKLSPFDQEKRLLYLAGDELTEHLIACLEARAIKTQRKERFVEDFFLLDDAGTPVAICEVKGLDANVKGQHVAQLNLHRSQHELEDDLPGVLLANTFRKAKTFAEKQDQIQPKTRKQAARLHITVVRTLDLLRLFDLMDTGQLDASGLLTCLTEKPGWLRVDPDSTWQVLHE
jgi:hypothetical protein